MTKKFNQELDFDTTALEEALTGSNTLQKCQLAYIDYKWFK